MSKAQRTMKYREQHGIKSEPRARDDKHNLAAMIQEFYAAHARTDEYEPKWINPAYDTRYMTAHEMREFLKVLKQTGPHHDPIFGDRYVEEGAKVGTNSWIFMGRRDCTPELIDGWVVISRTWRGTGNTYWMAYSLTEPMGMSRMTDPSIGPCDSREEVVKAIFATSLESEDAAAKTVDAIEALTKQGVKMIEIGPDGSVKPGKLK